MVKIFDMKVNKNIAYCKYIPENSNMIGELTVDVNSREIVSINYSDYKYGKKMYASHAKSKLFELLSSGKPLPKEAKAIWY